MKTNGDDATHGGLEERFYARQHAEIMARVAASRRRRRTVRVALPLAAAIVAGLVTLGWLVQERRQAAPGDWLYAWELPAEIGEAPDALGTFDPALEVATAADDGLEMPFVLPSFEELSGQESATSDGEAPTLVPGEADQQKG